MADHFKLEIGASGTKITTFTNVDDNFAENFRDMLQAGKEAKNLKLTDDFSPALQQLKVSINQDSSSSEDNTALTESSDESKSKYFKANYTQRLSTRRRTFRELSYNNFKVPNVCFITLTFDPNKSNTDWTVIDNCHKEFKKFIQRIKRKFSNFIYIATFSRMKNANWHYHIICNLPLDVTNVEIQPIWGLGMTSTEGVEKHSRFDTVVSYCITNMDEVAVSDLCGQKGYMYSKGLRRNVVLTSWSNPTKAYACLAQLLEKNKQYPLSNIMPTAFQYLRRNGVFDDLVFPTDSRHTQLSESTKQVVRNNAPKINYLITHDSVDGYFDTWIVAKRISDLN